MIEVVIDQIRVSLMSQDRLVVLKDINNDRYLPIWIGSCEADAITVELQDQIAKRPLTHDLLKTAIQELGGRIEHILINDLRNDIFYARILINVGEKTLEIDARPSDAIALAVRAKAPVYVAETVMDRSSIVKEDDIEKEISTSEPEEEVNRLSAFADFLDSLDLDDLADEDE
jgi:bifunctional DNase/RNase